MKFKIENRYVIIVAIWLIPRLVFCEAEKNSFFPLSEIQKLLPLPSSGSLKNSNQPRRELGQKGMPFEGIDQTWQNGSDRRDSSVFNNLKYFSPSIFLDVNYNYSFNDPIDHSVIGSTALARHNELQLSALHFGGDFTYQNARARIMTQFGTRSIMVPRNDLSSFRGQSELSNVYRNLSEAYVGYHIDKWYGINIDFGMFMSYIGLNSYYQPENWEYQASFTSDNTPWFFVGSRVQIHPNKNCKLETWLINGWQSYGKFNKMPGLGGSFMYLSSNSKWKFITNDYFGTDVSGIPDRIRFHSDNSVLHRYYNQPKNKKISRIAFSLTGDIGFEKGGGVGGFNQKNPTIPAQYFISFMGYHRTWFSQNKFAWTMGGGWMSNPGRYLVLLPTGQASPLPNPLDPTRSEGLFPFSANPGDPFKGWDWSSNLDWMPNQSITFRLEFVQRHSSVPYFSGRGGVTSQSGLTTTPLSPDWRPELVRMEKRLIFAVLFRL